MVYYDSLPRTNLMIGGGLLVSHSHFSSFADTNDHDNNNKNKSTSNNTSHQCAYVQGSSSGTRIVILAIQKHVMYDGAFKVRIGLRAIPIDITTFLRTVNIKAFLNAHRIFQFLRIWFYENTK